MEVWAHSRKLGWGLGVALIRRLREIVWMLWGFVLGWRYSSLAPEGGGEDQPR